MNFLHLKKFVQISEICGLNLEAVNKIFPLACLVSNGRKVPQAKGAHSYSLKNNAL